MSLEPLEPTGTHNGPAMDRCLHKYGEFSVFEWTIDGTVEDVGVFSRRVPNRGRVTLALLPRSCLPHLRCIYRFEAPTDPFKVH